MKKRSDILKAAAVAMLCLAGVAWAQKFDRCFAVIGGKSSYQLRERKDIYVNPTTNEPYTGKALCQECAGEGETTECWSEDDGNMRNGKRHGEWIARIFDLEGSGGSGVADGGYSVFNYKDGVLDGRFESYGIGLATVGYYKYGKNIGYWSRVDYRRFDRERVTDEWKLYDGDGRLATVNNSSYTVEDGILFSGDKTVLIQCPGSKQGAYTIPNTATSIKKMAGFSGSFGLTAITIPNSVASIGENTFSGCTNLASIDVAADNVSYSSENGVLFNKGKTLLIRYPAGKKGAYTIPQSVKAIESRAFSGCSDLAFIICLSAVPPKISGSETFDNASRSCLSVPQGSIAAYRKANFWKDFTCINAIMEFDTLSTGNAQKWDIGKFGADMIAVLSNGTLTIRGTGDMKSYDCRRCAPWNESVSSIVSAVIMDGVTSVGSGVFAGCTSLTSVTVSNTITRIDRSMFSDCKKLGSIKVSDGHHEYSSFDGVVFNKAKDSLVLFPYGKQGEFTVPGSVKSIENGAFANAMGLTAVTILNGAVSIGDNAFKDCKNLKSITIPNSVKSIGKDAFSGCNSLETINMAGDHPRYSFVDGLLYNKSKDTLILYIGGKTTVAIPGSVTTVGDGAFSGRSDLKAVMVPNSVTSIGKNAFSHSGLTSISISGGVASIGDFAFSGCLKLTSVTVKNSTPPPIGSYTFYYINAAACTLYVPQGSVYATTTGWNGFKHIGYMDSNGKVLQVVSSPAASFAAVQTAQQQIAQLQQTIDQQKKQLAECEVQKSDRCALIAYTLGTAYFQYAQYNAVALGGAGSDYSMALQTFQRLLKEYPNSQYEPTVKQMLGQIEILSLPPEQQQAAWQRQAAAQQAAALQRIAEQQAAMQTAMRQTIDQQKKQLAECEVQKSDRCAVIMYTLGNTYFQYAQYKLGGAGRDYSMAIQTYQQMLNEYPTSPYTQAAKQMLTQIEAMQKSGQ